MKIADGFVLKNIADSYVVVPVGDNLVDFASMITINETGAFIWNLLNEDRDMDYIVSSLCAEYDIDSETAGTDAEEFLNILRENKVLAE